MEDGYVCLNFRCTRKLTGQDALDKLSDLKQFLDNSAALRMKIDKDFKALIPSNHEQWNIIDIPLLSKIIENAARSINENEFKDLNTQLGRNFSEIAESLKSRTPSAKALLYSQKIFLTALPFGGKSRRLKKRRKKTRRRR